MRAAQDRYEVLALSGPLEPASMLISGSLCDPLLARRTRAWIVEPRGASARPAAVVVVIPFGPRSAAASLLCFDPAAAPTVAALLVASPARRMAGAATHLDPVAALLPAGRELRMPLSVVAEADLEPLAEPDPRARLAAPADLEALDALYDRFELEVLPAGPRRRRVLAELVARRRIVVVEEGGLLVGAMRCELRTGRHDWWSGYTVLPECRRRGIGRALEREAQGVSFSLGHRMAGATAPTNPIPYPAAYFTGDDWVERALPPAPPSTVARARRKARRTLKRWAP